MTRPKRQASVKSKLTLSFSLIISVLTVVIGMSAFALYSSNYNKEIEQKNDMILQQFCNNLDEQIFYSVMCTYFDLANNTMQYPDAISFFQEDIYSQHNKLVNIRQSLSGVITANPNLISSIDIYYKKSSTLISSSSGLTYLQQIPSWVQTVANSPVSMGWHYGKTNSVLSDMMILTGTYPANTTGSNFRGCYSLSINPQSFIKLFNQYKNNETQFYLLNRTGTIICSDSEFKSPTEVFTSDQLKHIYSDSDVPLNFNSNLNGNRSIISYINTKYADCILVSVCSVDTFYQESIHIRNLFILICLSTFFIGLALAFLFAKRLYHPLQNLMLPIKQMYDTPFKPSSSSANEYDYIEEVFRNLSLKATNLKQTLAENSSLIQYGLIESLLNNTITDKTVFLEKCEILGLPANYPFFLVILFTLPTDFLLKSRTQEQEFICFQLIEKIEKSSYQNMCFYATQGHDHSIRIICNSKTKDYDEIISILHDLVTFCNKNFDINPQVCVSQFANEPLQIHKCFKETLEIRNYAFFMPWQTLLSSDTIPALSKTASELPIRIAEDLSVCLKERNILKSNAIINSFVQACNTGEYTCEECNSRLNSLVFILCRYLKDMNLFADNQTQQSLNEEFLQCCNINQFGNWINNTIKNYLDITDKKSNQRQKNIIEKVKAMIKSNLSCELSLDYVSEQFQFSPNHLSKIFKEETGMNFVDYINQCKLDQAVLLLKTTELTIDEIALQSSFNSSTYFIKKFKNHYGITPKNYRSEHL